MTKPISVFTIIAATAFASIVALDGAIFPSASANASRTPPSFQPTLPGPEATLIPIEELQGPGPEPCALEVCSSNVPDRTQTLPAAKERRR